MAKNIDWTLKMSKYNLTKISRLIYIQRTTQTQRLIQIIIDADGGGTIGLDELENPLIGLGFADTREDVEKLIMSVDTDGNGDIDFGEF